MLHLSYRSPQSLKPKEKQHGTNRPSLRPHRLPRNRHRQQLLHRTRPKEMGQPKPTKETKRVGANTLNRSTPSRWALHLLRPTRNRGRSHCAGQPRRQRPHEQPHRLMHKLQPIKEHHRTNRPNMDTAQPTPLNRSTEHPYPGEGAEATLAKLRYGLQSVGDVLGSFRFRRIHNPGKPVFFRRKHD